mmetsp:Transcript_21028/g.29686  ORF Transcript_21028/g.29686 Transcript_21028/m.29686 type:complete len:525 (-) Transcript_21028:43-1617(-)
MPPRSRVGASHHESDSEQQEWSPPRININYRPSLRNNSKQFLLKPFVSKGWNLVAMKLNWVGWLYSMILIVAILQLLGTSTLIASNTFFGSMDEQNMTPLRIHHTEGIHKNIKSNSTKTSTNSLRKENNNRDGKKIQPAEGLARAHYIAVGIGDDNGTSGKTIDLNQFDILESDQTEHIDKSDFRKRIINEFEDEDEDEFCRKHAPPMYEWQDSFYPSCNSVHEIDTDVARRRQGSDTLSRLVNSGFNRDVWKVEMSDGTEFALKSLKYENKFNVDMFDQQRIDAVISERLTSSKYVASIYGFCGYTALYDYSEEGSLQDHYKTFSKKEKLMAAWRIARGLADVHTLGGGKKSAIVHADIHPRQYVSIHGEYYLTDFNTARLMRWDRLNNRRCPARMYNHPTDCNRSPDENLIIGVNHVDEGVDVYSLGNTFYSLLANHRAYKNLDDVCLDLIRNGTLPILPEEVIESTHPVDIALKHAFEMCVVFDREERASALEVADYLEGALNEIQSKAIEESKVEESEEE